MPFFLHNTSQSIHNPDIQCGLARFTSTVTQLSTKISVPLAMVITLAAILFVWQLTFWRRHTLLLQRTSRTIIQKKKERKIIDEKKMYQWFPPPKKKKSLHLNMQLAWSKCSWPGLFPTKHLGSVLRQANQDWLSQEQDPLEPWKGGSQPQILSSPWI